MSDGINIGVNVNLGSVISELKSSYAGFNERKDKAAAYDELLNKYQQSIEIIEQLKHQIEELQKNKLPTKDEVESISSMLDLINKLDAKTLNKINRLGGQK